MECFFFVSKASINLSLEIVDLSFSHREKYSLSRTVREDLCRRGHIFFNILVLASYNKDFFLNG